MATRRGRQQAKFERRRAATDKAADKDAAAKAALARKVGKPGGAGRLSRKELKIAKRMGEGEGR